MKSALIPCSLFLFPFLAFASTIEISVDLKMDNIDYVAGERIRAVVDVANSSTEKISVGYSNSEDQFFIEVFKSRDMLQMEEITTGAFVSPFRVESNEGQKLETFLGDHYALRDIGKYLAKPVLVHGGVRYEGQIRAFSVVPGMKVATALQMFKNQEGLRREFELLSWSRNNIEHLFLAAHDEGTSGRRWVTTDLGAMMRINKPTITVLSGGEVVILHRYDRDHYLRTEFWSLPAVLELHSRQTVQDPETAGSERVRELYKESGITPKANPWWKFW